MKMTTEQERVLKKKVNKICDVIEKYFYLLMSGVCLGNLLMLVDVLIFKYEAYEGTGFIPLSILNSLFAFHWVPKYLKACDKCRGVDT